MSLIRFFLEQSRTVVMLSLVAGVISGASNAALLAVINGALKRDQAAPALLLVAFVGLCVLLPLTRFASETRLNILGQDALATLRMDLIRRALAAPLRHVEQVGPDRLLAALTDDIPLITGSIVVIPLLCVNATVVVGCLVYMGLLSPLLLAIVLGFMALGIGTYQFPIVRASQAFRLGALDGEALIKHFRAVTQGMKELKLHRGRRRAFLDDVVAPAAASLKRHNTKGMTIYTAASSWGQTLVFVVIGLVVFVLPRAQPIDTATRTGYVLSLLYLMVPLQIIMNMLPGLARSNVALNRVRHLGHELSAHGVDDSPDMKGAGIDGAAIDAPPAARWRELRFASVLHAYRREGDPIDFALGPLSLTFASGELVFIIGGNGSGKTTFIKLLTGLYAPQDGAILVDGDAVSLATRDQYRQRFSVVFADFFLFDALLGLQTPETPAVDHAARQYLDRLQLADKVRIERGRLSTLDLSQGQRKRLALLTAWLEDRPVYVFDEWAADQDPYFKNIFYLELLPELKARGKTIFVISHDERYYHLADRIIKLEDGQVVSDTRTAARDVRAGVMAIPTEAV
jgi:putative ATP-binding cassette transporter